MVQNNINSGSNESKSKTPLLVEDLSSTERVMLGQMVNHGGYQVLVKLMDALCTRVTQDIVKLNPEEPDYDHKLSVRTQRARNINETCSEILKSVEYHVNVLADQTQQEEIQAVDSVAKTFGIHRVPPKRKSNAPTGAVQN